MILNGAKINHGSQQSLRSRKVWGSIPPLGTHTVDSCRVLVCSTLEAIRLETLGISSHRDQLIHDPFTKAKLSHCSTDVPKKRDHNSSLTSVPPEVVPEGPVGRGHRERVLVFI